MEQLLDNHGKDASSDRGRPPCLPLVTQITHFPSSLEHLRGHQLVKSHVCVSGAFGYREPYRHFGNLMSRACYQPATLTAAIDPSSTASDHLSVLPSACKA